MTLHLIENLVSRLKASRLAAGMAWSVVAALLSRLAAMGSAIVLARLLGRDKFGEIGIIQSTISAVGVFAGLGLGTTATKFVSELKARAPERAAIIVRLCQRCSWISSVVLALLFALAAQRISTSILQAPQLKTALVFGGAAVATNAIIGTQIGILMGLEKFRAVAKINMITGAVTFVAVIAGGLWLGVVGVILGNVIGQLVNVGLNSNAIRAAMRDLEVNRAKDIWSERSILSSFALPALATSILVVPVGWVCNVIITRMPGGLLEIGEFNAANLWFTALMFIPSAMGQAVFPALSASLSSGRGTESNRLLLQAIRLNAIVVLPLVVVGVCASTRVMSLFGRDFSSGAATLVVVLATAATLAVQTPVGYIVAAAGKMWTGFFMNLGWAIVFIAATYQLREYGAFGLALARLIAYVIHAAWTFGFAVSLTRKNTSISITV